jgi:hypothetical protein
MKLSQYPRPKDDTGLGIHGGANIFYPMGELSTDYPFWISELKQMGFKWYKLAVGGESGGEAVKALVDAGIMPIVRLYRPEPNPGCMVDDDPKGKDWVKKYVDLGVRYFEVNNEPNLLNEWKGGWGASDADPTEWKKGNQPQRAAQSWVKDAEFVIAAGGLPAIPALSPGGNYNDVDFFRAFLVWLKQHNYTDLLAQGCWISIHNGTLNHPLDYPADEVNQKGIPITQQEFAKYQWAGDINFVNGERARGKNPGQTLLSVDANGKDTGGSNCWLKFQAYHDLFVETFGFELPVLGTEGGVWCDVLADPRYPKITVEMQRDWTVEISRRVMACEYPDYYFCTGFWLIANRGMGSPTGNGFENDAWYSYWRADTGGHLPVVEALKALPKKVRRGPADLLPPPQPAGASRIYGNVVDSRSAAAIGAVVQLRSPAVDPRDASADAQGKYEFAGLPAGAFTVSAADASQSVKTDGKLAYKADLTISAKDAFKYVITKKQILSREEGVCSCVKGCGIYGTVVDNDGNPLKGVRLRVSWSGGSADVTTADGTGRYQYCCTPGEQSVTVSKGDWPSETAAELKTDWVPDHCYGKVVWQADFKLKSMSPIAKRSITPPVPGDIGDAAQSPPPPTPPKLGHYLLLGKPSSGKTRHALMAAADFVLKSGLTVGFSLDEAAGANAITIVGGSEVVSVEAEQSLRNLGRQVDRIGGDLAQVLDALYDLGSRRAVRGGRAASPQGPTVHAGKASVILNAAPAPEHENLEEGELDEEKPARGRRTIRRER